MISNIQKVHEKYIDKTCAQFVSNLELCERWKPIEITGRWKIIKTNGENRLFLEKKEEKGIFRKKIIKTWIGEEYLRFIHQEIYINKCGD